MPREPVRQPLNYTKLKQCGHNKVVAYALIFVLCVFWPAGRNNEKAGQQNKNLPGLNIHGAEFLPANLMDLIIWQIK